jgi:hypothetical protein
VALAGLALPAVRERSVRTPEDEIRWRFAWALFGTWVAVAAAGAILLLAGASLPGQRLVQFCLALPALAAIGLARMWTLDAPARRRAITPRRLAALAGVTVWVLIAWLGWTGTSQQVSDSALEQTRAAGVILGRQPPGTPLILVADTDAPDAARSLVRDLNYLRAAVPPPRVRDVVLFVGTPSDLATGTPRRTGEPEHDRLAEASWGRVREVLDRHPVALVLRAFDPHGFDEAVVGHPSPASGVAYVDPYVGSLVFTPCRGCGLPPEAASEASGPGPLSPWTPAWLALIVLAILWVVGWPWAGLASLAERSRVALAPAFGLAAVGLSAILVDLVGIQLASAAGGVLSVLGPIIVGLGATPSVRRRIDRRGGQLRPSA